MVLIGFILSKGEKSFINRNVSGLSVFLVYLTMCYFGGIVEGYNMRVIVLLGMVLLELVRLKLVIFDKCSSTIVVVKQEIIG